MHACYALHGSQSSHHVLVQLGAGTPCLTTDSAALMLAGALGRIQWRTTGWSPVKTGGQRWKLF